MPKTIKNIYDNSVSFENLLKAHKKLHIFIMLFG